MVIGLEQNMAVILVLLPIVEDTRMSFQSLLFALDLEVPGFELQIGRFRSLFMSVLDIYLQTDKTMQLMNTTILPSVKQEHEYK